MEYIPEKGNNFFAVSTAPAPGSSSNSQKGMDFVHPDPCRPKVKPHPLIEELGKFLMPVSRDSRLELSKLRIHSSPGPSPIPTN